MLSRSLLRGSLPKWFYNAVEDFVNYSEALIMSYNRIPVQCLEPHVRVKQLANFERTQLVDPRVPVHRYFRSGTEMLRMANMYKKEGQIENAFILYSKYITLFVERIPKHPDYKLMSDTDKAATKKTLLMVFPIAEKLKSQLEEEYAKQYAKWLEEKDKYREEKNSKLVEPTSYKIEEDRDSSTLSLPSETIRFGSQSFEPSDGSSDSSRFIGSSSSGSIIYPDVNISALVSPISTDSSNALSDNWSSVNQGPTPTVDRSTKPRSLLSPGPETEYGHGLRMVVVPNSLMQRFMCLALSNTNLDIETCGILTGKMVHNELLISHLLIPKQRGTSDSCTTDNEEEIFAYQDKYDLLTIGWIHTHPSQTAFMSSVDLHTHCSYQLVMPEAIAIVCSPKYKENGIFSLTDGGLDYISGCRETGFHLHTVDKKLYSESPHVKLADCEIVVADMR